METPSGIVGLQTLQSISTRLIPESAPQALYIQILDAAIALMAADAASLQMLAPDQASLTLLAWRNFHPDSAVFWQRVTVASGSTCGKALADNERVLVADIEACDFMAGMQDQQEYRRSGIRSVQSTPLRSRSGRPLGMLSTHWRTPHTPTEDDFRLLDVLARQAADVIERALAENALRESEERFRLAMNNVAAGVYTLDLNGLVTYVNPAAETMFGWTNAELLGRKMHDVTHYKHPDGTSFSCERLPGPSSSAKGSRTSRARGHVHSERWQFLSCCLQCVAVEEPMAKRSASSSDFAMTRYAAKQNARYAKAKNGSASSRIRLRS